MNAVKPASLALQRLYLWEKTAPERVALTQPMGGGAVPATFFVDAHGQVRLLEVGYTTGLGLRVRLWWAGL